MQSNDTPDSPSPEKEERPRRRIPWLTWILFIGLTLSLVVSLSANVVLYRQMREYYERAGDARSDLVGEDQFAADNAELGDPKPDAVRIVFAGDSDVEHWDPLPEADGCEIVARGLGGDRTGDLLVRLQRDVIDLKPAVAVVTIGGNDLEDIALLPDREETLVTICERNLRAIVDRLRQKGIQVILLTILPYGDLDAVEALSWSNATYGAVQCVNAMIRTLDGPGVTVVDCDPILAQPNGHRKAAYTEEMIHLNTTGYQALNEALLPLLEALAKKEKP
jgi:lysophospholipase L1-like esterase